MKNSTLLLSFFFFLFSCGQNKNQISVLDQSELLRNDPVSIEFFEAIADAAKVSSEGYFSMEEYQKIIGPHKENLCSSNLDIFKDNLEMIKYAEATCRIIKRSKVFYDKHPFVRDMPTKERQELFKLLAKKPDYDMGKIKRNSQKRMNEMSEDEKKKVGNQAKERYSNFNKE